LADRCNTLHPRKPVTQQDAQLDTIYSLLYDDLIKDMKIVG